MTNKKGEPRRFGFLTSDENLAKVIKHYSRRWRVENWLKAGKLDLYLDILPGLTVIYENRQIGGLLFSGVQGFHLGNDGKLRCPINLMVI